MIRQAAASARQCLIDFAAKSWQADAKSISVQDGKASIDSSSTTISYADLASNAEAMKLFSEAAPSPKGLTDIKRWKRLGKPFRRPGGQQIVTGQHEYPSDISRPGMLYGKVLRAPSYVLRRRSNPYDWTTVSSTSEFDERPEGVTGCSARAANENESAGAYLRRHRLCFS